VGRRAAVAIALVALLLAVGAADAYLDGLARDNLSNATFPRTHERTPWQMGLPSSNVTIPSDGLRLTGWWMPAPAGSANASTTIVLVHGVSSQMGKPVRMWAPMLHAAGYSLLAFDLRNHGASPDAHGGLVTYGVDESRDVLAAAAWVRGNAAGLHVDPARIVLYGMSMGAASVLNAMGADPPGVVAVVADSPYASFRFQAHVDGARKGYPGWLVDLVVAKMDALAPSPPSASRPDLALAATATPVLLAQCSNDQRVTLPNQERLAAARHDSRERPPTVHTWAMPCGPGLSPDHHVDGAWQPGYNATVLSFLRESQQVFLAL
jgi:pimeloyl-ACP methyl ester carboxylesterase